MASHLKHPEVTDCFPPRQAPEGSESLELLLRNQKTEFRDCSAAPAPEIKPYAASLATRVTKIYKKRTLP